MENYYQKQVEKSSGVVRKAENARVWKLGRFCRINTNRYTQWKAKRKLPKSLPGQLFAMRQGMDKWPVQHFLSASSLKGNSVHKRTMYLNIVNLPSHKKYNFKTILPNFC